MLLEKSEVTFVLIKPLALHKLVKIKEKRKSPGGSLEFGAIKLKMCNVVGLIFSLARTNGQENPKGEAIKYC